MANESMKFTLDFLARTAGLKDAAQFAELLGDELDDTVDGGKRLADAMRQMADHVEADLMQTRAMAERLAQSLGPELSASLGQAKLDQFATNLRQAGMSADQLDTHIDSVADSVRRLDKATAGVDKLDTSMRKVGSTTDNTRSVVANFAGNATQELPGIATAMGPLSMAMGQFAEYATEGNIGMKKFVGAAAGLGAATAAMWAISKGAEQAAERTKKITEAMEDLGRVSDERALQSFVDMLSMAMLNGEEATDVLDRLAETNVEGARRMLDLAEAAGFSDETITALRDSIIEVETETAQAAETEEKYGDSLSGTAEAAADAAVEIDRGRDSISRQTAATYDAQFAQDALTKALERNEDAQRSLTDARLAAIDQGFAFRAATDGLAVALESYAAAVDDPKTATDEFGMSQDNAARAALDMATAYQTSAEQLAEAAGAPLTAAESQQKFIESLYQTALSLDPDSPLRKQLVGYINTLNEELPTSVETELSIKDEQALTKFRGVKDKSGEAKTKVGELKDKIGELPGDVKIPVSMPGLGVVSSDIETLIGKLRRLKTAADNANTAVDRVIGGKS